MKNAQKPLLVLLMVSLFWISALSMYAFYVRVHNSIEPAVNWTAKSIPTAFPITRTPSITPSPTRFNPSIMPTFTRSVESDTLSEVNAYRESYGLSKVSSDSITCEFAKLRANEIMIKFSHEAFENRISSDLLPYNNWVNVVENIANSPAGDPMSLWKNSPPHEINLRSDIRFACIQNRGNYYVFEGWR